jgi:CDP-glucose 4,6-dehydratase
MNSFWQGKRVFLTGHTGFKGAWLSLWLSKLGAKVTGFALEPPTTPSLFRIASIDEKVISCTGDIRNFDFFSNQVSTAKPEIVIHMAAQALVRESYKNPVDTYATNIMGTVHLLEIIRTVPSVKAAVIVTSDKCYENRERSQAYRENEPMGGYDPYSSSKGCAELATNAYRRSFFNPAVPESSPALIATVRAGNVIGGGDWAEDRIIPDCMKAILENRKIIIRNPDAIRPWQHVLEPLHGYLILAQKLYENGKSYAEPWNFGPDDQDAITVKDLVKKLCDMWKGKAEFTVSNDAGPHEAHFLKLDSTKARSRLGWKPVWNINRALESITDWYEAFQDGQTMSDVCLKQIEEYETTAHL